MKIEYRDVNKFNKIGLRKKYSRPARSFKRKYNKSLSFDNQQLNINQIIDTVKSFFKSLFKTKLGN